MVGVWWYDFLITEHRKTVIYIPSSKSIGRKLATHNAGNIQNATTPALHNLDIF